MKRLLLIAMIFISLFTGCIKSEDHIKFTYKTETISKFNDIFNGVDTNYILIDSRLIKTWMKYEATFNIIDANNKNNIYTISDIDHRRYTWVKSDTTTYKIKYFNDAKQILGYSCRKVMITSASDTIVAYYTKQLGVNYSPAGKIDGFVLEYFRKSKMWETKSVAVAVEKDTPERISIPDNYEKTTFSDLKNLFAKINSKENRRKMVSKGEEAPEFSISDINGKVLDIKEKRGKVIVLNFWFIGCRGCVYEIPFLNEAVEHFNEYEDVEFYAITTDPKSQIMKFLRKKQFDFTIVPNALPIRYLYGVYSFPTTILIDKQGKVNKTYSLLFGSNELISDISELSNN